MGGIADKAGNFLGNAFGGTADLLGKVVNERNVTTGLKALAAYETGAGIGGDLAGAGAAGEAAGATTGATGATSAPAWAGGTEGVTYGGASAAGGAGAGAGAADSLYGPYASGYQYDPNTAGGIASQYGYSPAAAVAPYSGVSGPVAGVGADSTVEPYLSGYQGATPTSASGYQGETPTSASGYTPPSFDGPTSPSGGGVSPSGAPVSDISTQASKGDIATAKSADAYKATVDKTWGEAKSLASKYGLPLAAMMGNLRAKQIPQQDHLNAQQTQMTQLGNDLLAKYKAGEVNPTQQATLDKFRSDAQAQAKQYLQNSGQGADSSAMQKMTQDIDANVAAQKEAMLKEMYTEGLQALQIADSATEQLIKLKLGQDQRSQATVDKFLDQYYRMNGMQPPAQTPAPVANP